MPRRIQKSTAPTVPVGVPPPVLNEVEVSRTPPQTPLAPTDVSATPQGILNNIPKGIASLQQTPLIWRYRDADIELGNRFPYAADNTTDCVADFEVRGKVVKSFLGKDPMYNQNLNLKATNEDVTRIKAIVLTVPDSNASEASFEWPFEANKEGVFKFVNKDNLEVDFTEIFDAAKMKDVYDVAERRRHSLEASDVKLGSKAMVEFTIAIWKKKPDRAGCTFHLISVGVLERVGDNVSRSFLSPKKRQRTGM